MVVYRHFTGVAKIFRGGGGPNKLLAHITSKMILFSSKEEEEKHTIFVGQGAMDF